jgi:hypothetical protein
MTIYARYNYYYNPKTGIIVNNRTEPNNPKMSGYHFIGSWYAHEQLPYISNGKICRMRYGKIVVLKKINEIME